MATADHPLEAVVPPLVWSANVRGRVEAAAVAAYPQEGCGVLVGRRETAGDSSLVRVTKAIATRNIADFEERYRRFVIDPKQLLQIDRESADAGLEVIGFYHGHPDHPARPSDTDLRQAWPVYSYVIVSVTAGAAVDLASWVLGPAGETFDPQQVVEK